MSGRGPILPYDAGADPALVEALAELAGLRRSPSRHAAGRARVMAAAAATRQERAQSRWARWRRRGVGGALALAGANLVLGGIVAAAAGAQPDSVLYGVKRAAEAVKLTLTFDAQDKARLQLELADRRAAEAETMARTGHAQLALDAARDATSLVEQASATLSANPSVENEQAVAHASAEAKARLTEVFAALENGDDPGAADAARGLDAEWARGLGGTQESGAEQSPGAAGGAGSAGGAGPGGSGAANPGAHPTAAAGGGPGGGGHSTQPSPHPTGHPVGR